MNLVFCGTPVFAVPTLERLVDAGFGVKLVVTQPDRASGRGMELAASPVKRSALEFDLPITQPDKIKSNDEFRAQLENIGESISGVTTMRLDAGLDTGDMLMQAKEPIQPEDTAITLGARLAKTGAELMITTLAGLANRTLHPQPQDDSKATLAPILKKGDGVIDFSRTATEAWNRLRGFQPWPGAFTTFRGKTLQIHAAMPAPEVALVKPGRFTVESGRLLMGFAHGSTLEVRELQVEGKKRMAAHGFINGYRPRSDELLGASV